MIKFDSGVALENRILSNSMITADKTAVIPAIRKESEEKYFLLDKSEFIL